MWIKPGFWTGGIPPLGHPRPVRVVMDPDLGRYPEIWAAAGQDRSVFPISPAALRALTSATVAEIAEIAPDVPRAGSPAPDLGTRASPPGRLAAPGT